MRCWDSGQRSQLIIRSDASDVWCCCIGSVKCRARRMEEAVYWYRQAANAGDTNALVHLADEIEADT